MFILLSGLGFCQYDCDYGVCAKVNGTYQCACYPDYEGPACDRRELKYFFDSFFKKNKVGINGIPYNFCNFFGAAPEIV